MENPEPIAFVGIGCRFPGGTNSPSALWELLCKPQDLLTPIPEARFATDGFYHKTGQYHGHTNVKSSYFLSGTSDHRKFDAQFFGISPVEASVIDPQVRLLLETVYEALENSGLTMESLRGSNTSVYSGAMTYDYEHIMGRDEDAMAAYHVTGTAKSLISNRISYFFDWHGPSMTIDTACSSSLYAVHHAIQQLRSGNSRVAIATGCNLLLDPLGYATESNLNMLSPSGRSRMWDESADGYGRGDGIAAVVLKTLSAAEADNDSIYCVIRETCVNQDGRTPGITMPSASAQASMIRDCYKRAGLNIDNPLHQPQYFEAHGTGTPAGDPIEAEAISSAFFSSVDSSSSYALFVGSIKTIIGHTEGTAGLAGLIKAALALQHSVIPPNMLFNRLNPQIEPFYKRLCVPVYTRPWPKTCDEMPRRASVNSFGFGGANAHAILESYSGATNPTACTSTTSFCPLIFSAASETSLVGYLEEFHKFLTSTANKFTLRNLAFTLYARRDQHAYTVAFSAPTVDALISNIARRLDSFKNNPIEGPAPRIRQLLYSASPRILAIFTGQGAQWAGMGKKLLESSIAARKIISNLDVQLASLPVADRPTWSISSELHKGMADSQIDQAEISQPLCTAVQILMVDLLRAAGVHFTAVVGHSSGEIAAAYASGQLTAGNAICIAYYRGLSLRFARGSQGQPGSMIAVGTSQSDVEDLLNEPEFKGRAWLAAVNSPISTTISGDADAIEELAKVLNDEKKFVRTLRVDRAYHSPHMAACSSVYRSYLENLTIDTNESHNARWFSSVHTTEIVMTSEEGKRAYWVENLVRPVLFKQSVEEALAISGPFDLAIEIGPHPALKGPTLQIMQPKNDPAIPYAATLQRGVDDVASFSDALGYMASVLGKRYLNLQAYETFMSGSSSFNMIQNLPLYRWNHENEFWHESRYGRAVSHRSDRVHEILGHLTPDCTSQEMRWRHLIRPKEVEWLEGHRLQGQIVFPAAGYVIAALEACLRISSNEPVSKIHVNNLEIGQALIFDDEEMGVETIVSITNIQRISNTYLTALFRYSAAVDMNTTVLDSIAWGEVEIFMGDSLNTPLRLNTSPATDSVKIKSEDFYDSLSKLEYEYSGAFATLSSIARKNGAVTAEIPNTYDSDLLIHPGVLDCAFQAVLLCASSPEDGGLWSIHVPSRIRHVRASPRICANSHRLGKSFELEAFQPRFVSSFIEGDVDIMGKGDTQIMIQVEGLRCVPMSPATAENDKVIFSTVTWDVVAPDISKFAHQKQIAEEDQETARILERAAFYYLCKLDQLVAQDDQSRSEGTFTPLFDLAKQVQLQAKRAELPHWLPEWEEDTSGIIDSLLSSRPVVADVRLLQALGPRLADIVADRASAIDIGIQGGLLSNFYQEGLGMPQFLGYLAETVKQILHRNPSVDCLEIGAGTGAATKIIHRETGMPFSTYTFTDVSSGFFNSVQPLFDTLGDRMIFKVLDVELDPCGQGFEAHSYDLVIASMVLHATPSLKETLKNVRRLLRPGGYLVVLEVQQHPPSRISTMFGAFPGWWLGYKEGRKSSPCVSLDHWHGLLLESGFSGCDTSTLGSNCLLHPFMLFATQALDQRTSVLRDPLDPNYPLSLSVPIKDLIIVSQCKDRTSSLTQALMLDLEPLSQRIKHCETLSDVCSQKLNSQTTILGLLDIESSIFQGLTEDNWESFKFMLQHIGSIFWVTQGRRAENPHSNMIVGLLRSAIAELPNLQFQLLDFDDLECLGSKAIAQAFLRFYYTHSWKENGEYDQAIEPELVVEKGSRIVVPRLIMHSAMNKRYNSSRRIIMTNGILGQDTFRIGASESGYVLFQDSLQASPIDPEALDTSTKVLYSLLEPILINGNERLFLSIVRSDATGALAVALSTRNASTVHPATSIQLEAEIPYAVAPCFLRTIALYHLAWIIRRKLEDGARILLHEPEPDLVYLLTEESPADQSAILFTSAKDGMPRSYHKIHPNALSRHLANLELEFVSLFMDYSVSSESKAASKLIQSCLGTMCQKYSAESSTYNSIRAISDSRLSHARLWLQASVKKAVSQLASSFTSTSLNCIIGLSEIYNIKRQAELFRVIDWTTPKEFPVQIQPVDTLPLFSAGKTYWLLGLTGSLGRSLCEWMIRRGAVYVVLTSRTPKIDSSWHEEMTTLGGVVKVIAGDVTNMRDLERIYAEINSTFPPLAGVAQGAMVLHDINFNDTSLSIFQKVSNPKVQGSINVDSLLRSVDLDFFVFLSSTSAIVGTPGQAPYSAANMFMASLAEQRRKRGQCASVINIGPVYGVGYIAEQGINTSTMLLMGVQPLSERDFHQQFAEAVVATRSKSSFSNEITTGIWPIRPKCVSQPRWISNPLMSHCISHDSITYKGSGVPVKISIKASLMASGCGDETYGLVRQSLIEKLHSLLNMNVNTSKATNFDEMGVDELGIDSLMATEIRSWLNKNFQVNIPVLKILAGMSVKELISVAMKGIEDMIHAESMNLPEPDTDTSSSLSQNSLNLNIGPESIDIGAHVSHDMSESPTELLSDVDHLRTRDQDYPLVSSLSLVQSMFWFASRMFENKASLNLCGVARIVGTLDFSRLRHAVKNIGQRHDCFRTQFFIEDGRVYQRIMAHSRLNLEHNHITKDVEVEKVVQSLKDHVFELEDGETTKVKLLSLPYDIHYLIVGTTHLCFDGFSVENFLQDLSRQYNQIPDIDPIPQYRDYVHKEARDLMSGEYDKELTFWKGQYVDFPNPLPILKVSEKTSRSDLASFDHLSVDLNLPDELKHKVQLACRNHGVTPFVFFFACFRVLLYRYSGAEDVAVGVADAHRNEETALCIGAFVNVIPIRFRLSPDSTFNVVLANAKALVLAGLENSNVPYQAVLQELDPPRSTTYTPLFQTFVNYRQHAGKRQMGNSEIEILSMEPSLTGYDLNLEIIDSPSNFQVKLFARRDLYQAPEVDMLLKSYAMLVEAFSQSTDVPVKTPSIYELRNVNQAVKFGQGKNQKSIWPQTVLHRVDDVARAHPQLVAVKGLAEPDMTYSDLVNLSGSIAGGILALELPPSPRVALLLEPSGYWVASILAIMRSGCICVPLDLATPIDRLRTIVKDCMPSLILYDKDSTKYIRELLQPGISSLEVSSFRPDGNLECCLSTGDEQSFILYTSGSTGVPKGVILHHAGILSQIQLIQDVFDIQAESVLQQSASGFDLCYLQVFIALCFGGNLVPLPTKHRKDATAIMDIIANKGITFTLATPTEYSSWLRFKHVDNRMLAAWRTAACAGEAVPQALLLQFRMLCLNDLRLFNAYGPTELGIVTAMEIPYLTPVIDQHKKIAAGYPLPNYTIFILDDEQNIVPPGVQGEVYMTGPSLAIGYLNNLSLIAERFLINPIDQKILPDKYHNLKFHRVGDLGRWRKDGTILIEGRVAGDTQIKLRGVRIDAQEIETALLEAVHGCLDEVVVTTRGSSQIPAQYIVSHVVFNSSVREEERQSVLSELKTPSNLPPQLWPAVVIELKSMPQTSSAKLDRKAVSEMPILSWSSNMDGRPENKSSIQCKLQDLWEEIISNSSSLRFEIDESTSFFHAGGTSLDLLELRERISSKFAINLSISQLIQFSTLKGMSTLIERRNISMTQEVDWDKETRLPVEIIRLDTATYIVPEESTVIVMTGATGYLGRALLDFLVQIPKVKRVHCIGVRDKDACKGSFCHEKVQLWEGDLKLPALGLSEPEARMIFSEADRIIHNGAEVSHLQSYHSLRLPNTTSTMELVKLSLNTGRRIPFHFVSTAQVGMYFAEETKQFVLPPRSVSQYPPSEGGREGYAASKWASERFLERLDESMPGGWPIYLHRPSLIKRPARALGSDLVHNVRHYSRILKAAPLVTHIHGYLNTVGLEMVVSGIIESVCANEPAMPGVRYLHYVGGERLPLDDPITAVLGPEDDINRRELGEIEVLLPKEWIKRARELGLPEGVAQWMESVEGQREQFFPELV